MLDDGPAPCPFCGLLNCPGGPGHTAADLAKVQFEEWSEEADRAKVRRDEVTGNRYVVATEPIWREEPIWHSTRTRRILVYGRGARVPYHEAVELGLVEEPEP